VTSSTCRISFQVALVRVTEIELGIAVATTVLAVTQFGDSRKRLPTTLRNLVWETDEPTSA
jgi:hypothetical protein